MADSVGISIGGTAAAFPIEFVPAIIALAEAVQANARAIETIARHIEGTPAATNTTVSGTSITMAAGEKPKVRKK